MVLAAGAAAQTGSIRGVVYDQDFEAPLPAAQVEILETGAKTETTDQGNYAITEVEPGTYTLVFAKEGYVRQVKTDVVVVAGRLTDVDAWLTGEFVEMDEFIVQDILIGTGTEAALLELRFETPTFMDSISAELMSRAGASDAAAALTLVSGATVEDGKFAVIRGLPDRYVSAQMNGVRLPTADEDKRAVELDQFPASVIESIQVSKTFTPDQQGEASGGAVNVQLKSVPDENSFEIKTQVSGNSQVWGNDEFLTYDGSDVASHWGDKTDSRTIQQFMPPSNWDGAVGVNTEDAPNDYKWSVSTGGKIDLDDGVRLGGFASIFYEKDSSYFDDGEDNSWWVTSPGADPTPEIAADGAETFTTSLFDIERSSISSQWGGLGTVGVETDDHKLGLTYLFTHSEESTTVLGEDTRGKQYFFPGYDPDDPDSEGNDPANLEKAPYLRTESLIDTERETSTLQLHGEHQLPWEGFELGDALAFKQPVLDWTLSSNKATFDQPDKRQFGSKWVPEKVIPPIPPFFPGSTTPATHSQFLPDLNINLGNLNRIWKSIEETSDQSALNLKLPFDQWDDVEGYFKFGWFDDQVERTFEQESFTNAADPNNDWAGGWDEFWSAVWEDEDHLISASEFDVSYDGTQDISAYYAMVDLPIGEQVNLIGGYRWEHTEITTTLDADELALYYPVPANPDEPIVPVQVAGDPGANAAFEQDDVLPAFAIEYRPTEQVTVRAAYSETVARMTFKELTPAVQQEFLGGPIFIGNPKLEMSSLKNQDLRVDYEPFKGSLVSASWFHKDVTNPIEYVQQNFGFTFTTPVNYPEGEISGIELELRQDLGNFWDACEGLSVGANATLIDSEVTLTDREQEELADPNIGAPTKTRDMTNAPEHLYNVYLTYDFPELPTQAALFYTVRGDTLVAGSGIKDNNFIPEIYELEYGTLNFSLSHELSERSKLQFQAKNLTNPEIEEVYRSDYIDDDVLRSTFTKGVEFSLSYTLRF